MAVPRYLFGANRKQVGSNIGSTEFFFGRCPTQCEQCFVNFGNNRHASKRQSEAYNAFARRQGWEGTPYLMPRRPDPVWNCRVSTVELQDGLEYPFFLRVCTFSDSAYPPAEWIRQLRQVWGDACFFNTSIRTALPASAGGVEKPGNLAEYHKIVVTVNGGRQEPRPLLRDQRKLTHEERTTLAVGSMGGRSPADFFDPFSLTRAGFPSLESIVKFYRLRCLSTIVPRFEVEAPVVMTPMRFYGVHYLLEFARKYGIAVEIHTSSKITVDDCAAFGITPTVRPGRTVARMYDSSAANVSPYAGEPTDYAWTSSYFTSDKRPLSEEPWVCGRGNGKCEACGLCASLDGMYGGAINPNNPIPPIPFSRTYLGTPWKEDWMQQNPFEAAGDAIFSNLLMDVWHANPTAPQVHEEDTAWLGLALAQVGRYYTKEAQGDHMDVGWRTDGDVETLLAYCYWLLCRRALRDTGHRPEKIAEWAEDYIDEGTGVPRVLDGIDDLDLLWANDGRWIDVFGSIFPED